MGVKENHPGGRAAKGDLRPVWRPAPIIRAPAVGVQLRSAKPPAGKNDGKVDPDAAEPGGQAPDALFPAGR